MVKENANKDKFSLHIKPNINPFSKSDKVIDGNKTNTAETS